MKEVVIKMPEEVYKSIINGKNYISYQEYVEEAIKNGTPLPKGHGELKDVKDISNLPIDCTYSTYGCINLCHCEDCTYAVVSLNAIKKVNTIIEADEGEELNGNL